MNEVEDEFHFLVKCNLYKDEREKLFHKVNQVNKNFKSLSLENKGTWLLMQDHIIILELLAGYIHTFILVFQ